MRLSASISTLLVVALMVASCAADDLVGNNGQAHGRSLLQRGKKKAAPKAAKAPKASKSPKPSKNAGGGKGKGKKSPPPALGMSPSPSPTASPSPSPSPTATPSPSPSPVATPSPSPTASPSPSPIDPSNAFAGTNCNDPAAMLALNNECRTNHSVAGVSWNAKLAADSTAYAAVLANKDNCKLVHSTPQDRGNAGENLAVYMSTAAQNESCKQAVQSWYDEVSDYNFNAARLFEDNWFRSDGKQIGHFTAIVWKGTTSMGCGRAVGPYKSAQGWTGTCKVIVCRYAPPGNVGSSQAFKDNVLPKKQP